MVQLVIGPIISGKLIPCSWEIHEWRKIEGKIKLPG
jgi:hypothetical protein